ncbi:alpha/beta hydrolase [Leuconostocaceae bacterium ESL0958]|nr:alpha/beta hydrolase [Leuconostocaceae bacterium ESL0958]
MKRFLLTVVSLGLLALLAFFFYEKAGDSGQRQQAPAQEQTATVFFHGYGSSRHAEQSMSQSLVDAGYSNRVLPLTVEKDGTIRMPKAVSAKDRNPIVLVQFNDNRNTDFATLGQWTTAIMKKLKAQGVTKVNVIGHSMGNMAIANYLMRADQLGQQVPTVQKQISLAGTYNGLILTNPNSNAPLTASGVPTVQNTIYQQLQPLKTYYAKHKTAVLNIYGNSQGGAQGDTTVYNNSSRALKSLVQSPSTYQEQAIEGPGGQHSKLHENRTVDGYLLDFLKN